MMQKKKHLIIFPQKKGTKFVHIPKNQNKINSIQTENKDERTIQKMANQPIKNLWK